MGPGFGEDFVGGLLQWPRFRVIFEAIDPEGGGGDRRLGDPNAEFRPDAEQQPETMV